MEEIGCGVGGKEVECILVVGEGDRGMGEEFNCGLRVRGLDRWVRGM